MEIEGFRIEGFANIERVNLKVGEQNALIAPNGYGKSNVLRAIEFGVGTSTCIVCYRPFRHDVSQSVCQKNLRCPDIQFGNARQSGVVFFRRRK